MKKDTWQLQEAKSRFSQLVENAVNERPQIVTKHGRQAVVVVSYEDYQRLTQPQTDLVTFLRESPLAALELEIERDRDLPRDVEF